MSYQRGMGLDYGADRLRSVDTGKSAGLVSNGVTEGDRLYLPPRQPSPPMDAIREVGTPATGVPIAMVAAGPPPSPIAMGRAAPPDRDPLLIEEPTDKSRLVYEPGRDVYGKTAPSPIDSMISAVKALVTGAPPKPPWLTRAERDCASVRRVDTTAAGRRTIEQTFREWGCETIGMIGTDRYWACRCKAPEEPDSRRAPPGNGMDFTMYKEPPPGAPPPTPPDLTTTKCAPGMEANQIPATATPIIGLAKSLGCSNVAGELWCCLPGTNLAMAGRPPDDKPPIVDRGFCPPNHVPDGYGGCVELQPVVVGPNGVQNGEALPPAMPVCAEGQAYDTVRQVCVSQAQAAAAGPTGLGAVPWWVWLAGAGVIGYVVWKRSEGGKAKTANRRRRR